MFWGLYSPSTLKGVVNNVNNYQGITLLSVLGNSFTRIVNNRLTDWAETYQIYIEAQAGFRKCMSIVDNVLYFVGLLYMLNGEKRSFVL